MATIEADTITLECGPYVFRWAQSFRGSFWRTVINGVSVRLYGIAVLKNGQLSPCWARLEMDAPKRSRITFRLYPGSTAEDIQVLIDKGLSDMPSKAETENARSSRRRKAREKKRLEL